MGFLSYPQTAQVFANQLEPRIPFQVGVDKRPRRRRPFRRGRAFDHGISPHERRRLGAHSPASDLRGNGVPLTAATGIQKWSATFERRCWRTAVRLSYLGDPTVERSVARTARQSHRSQRQSPFGTTKPVTSYSVQPRRRRLRLLARDMGAPAVPQNWAEHLSSVRNFGHGRTHAFKTEVNPAAERDSRSKPVIPYLDQKFPPAADNGNRSLGGTSYNQFAQIAIWHGRLQLGQRFLAYGTFDTPIGHGPEIPAAKCRAFTDYAVGDATDL